jgi:hypothetical protein
MAGFTISCPVGDEPLSPGNPNLSSKAEAYRFDCKAHGFIGLSWWPAWSATRRERSRRQPIHTVSYATI